MKLIISISTDAEDEHLKRARSQGYDTSKVWYHGSKNKFTAFELSSEKANRGTNIAGIYLTPYEWEAKKFGDIVYAVYTRTKRPYVWGKKNRITTEMLDTYGKLLIQHTNYKQDWFDSAIAPEFKKTGVFKDIDGGLKQQVLVAGGYDSWQDGRHLCVFDPTMIRSIDAEFNRAAKYKNNLKA